MKKALYQSVVLIVAATGAMAATFEWKGPTSGNWSTATNWVGDVAPDNDGTADIVFTNIAVSGLNSDVDINWNVNSLTYALGVNQSMNLRITGSATALSVGAGGIIGNTTSPWLFYRAPVKFTTADSYIKNKIYWYSSVDSTYAGGTKVHLQLTDFRADAMTTTTNVFYYLESGGPAIYQANVNALGSNKVYITVATPGVAPASVRNIGIYGTSPSNHMYFDTPLEFDAASVAPGGTRRFDLNFQRTPSVAGNTNITHVRGNWTMANGTTITNTGGLGWFWLSAGSSANDMGAQKYYEQDSSSIVSAPTGINNWAGDVFVYNGFHVINAPHAFKTNNSAFFNIGGASGGITRGSNNVLLATSGNHVNGIIRLTGGDAVTNGNPVVTNRPWATLGIEGTGSVEFMGNVSLTRYSTADTMKAMNLKLYAGLGGTAIFSGGISENNYAGSEAVGFVEVVGGGTVVLSGLNSYTNKTTVRENTTLQMDGSMTSEIEVLAGSTLKGEGNTSANVIIGGDFAPGTSIGTFTAYTDVDFLAGSTFTIELGPGNTSDLLDAYGDLDITGATLRLVGSDIGTFTIANYGTLTGDSFASIDTIGLTGGVTFESINYGGKDGNFISLTVIPEPASVLLMVSGLVAAWKLRRRA
jgi:hypothetical protein